MNEPLTDSNFLVQAAKYYDNSSCHTTEEFLEDLRRFKYIKKLLTRYTATGELKDRLILNHFIVLNNVFGPKQLSRMVVLKLRKQLHMVKPFLISLNIYQPIVRDIKTAGSVFDLEPIVMDEVIVSHLRDILYGNTRYDPS